MLVRAFFLTLIVSLPASCAFGADINFYSLQEQWAKENKVPKTGRAQALESGFSQAFGKQSPTGGDYSSPVPVTLRRDFREAAAASSPLEIEWGQTLLLEKVGGLVKFAASDEGIVTMESADTETLRLIGSSVGSTYVHVWNLPVAQASARQRTTFSVRVLQPRLTPSRSDARQRQALEKDRPFRMHYSNARMAAYDGDKFRDIPRRSVDFTQTAGLSGDTPYGELSGRLSTGKAAGKTLLSDAQVALRDGRVGPLENFNVLAGDSRVEPNLMVFPSARLRGGVFEKWEDTGRQKWTAFHGREDTNLFGTLTPQLLSKRTLNSYLSGGVLELKPNDDAQIKAAYFGASGRSRPDELNRRGLGARSKVKIGPHVEVDNETDFDNETFANRHSFTTRFEKLVVKNEFRDISKNFFTLLGPPSGQGEAGYLLDVTATPSPKWAFQGSFDVFRDRLVPNPEDPNRYNTHTDLSLDYFQCEDANYRFIFQDIDDTGRIGPTRLRNIGLQYNERFDLWDRRATIFARYNHRASHFLTNPLSDFRQNQATLGLFTSLFWGINASLQKEWSALEDVELGRTTYPAAFVLTFDTNRQIGQTPLFFEARVRLRDEEETESINSFMAGEDSAEFSGSLFWREVEDLELFLTGSLTQYVPESLNLTDPRVEAQFYTGLRGFFDTGLRWTVSGDFTGTVFKDTNGDGIRQEGETGLKGQAVQSSDGKEAVTDAEGRYALKGVRGKKASLVLEVSRIPHGYVPTNDAARRLDILPNKTQTVDFGLVPRSDVTGIVFNDLNGDGKYQQGEPPVPGMSLVADDGRSVRTNTQGVYVFTNALAGNRTVTLPVTRLPEGYLPLAAPKKEFVLFEGVRYELHFPLRAQRAVTGRVYWDVHRNGVMDQEDVPLEGATVRLGTRSVTTDKEGWYLFDNLDPGKYELSYEGFTRTLDLPNEPRTVTGADIPLEKAG